MIKEYSTIDSDFIRKIQTIVGNDFFEHYYLINTIGKVLNGNLNFYDTYILKDNETWIVGIWVNGNYMLYGENWKQKHIDLIKEKIDFKIFQSGFHFMGTTGLIENILEDNIDNFQIFKKRLYYSIHNLKSFKNTNEYNIGNGKIEDIDELTQMICDYFEDEYSGKNNKEYSTMKFEVRAQIEHNLLKVLKSKNSIKSICTVIPTSADVPIIGSFFTKRDERGKGYGSNLLFKITEEMIEKNNECWLIAEKDDIQSNKVFKKLGYKVVYETIDLYKK